MLILHTRVTMTDKSTVGHIAVDGLYFCLSLEDPQRKVKIARLTAIPPGIYRCQVIYSPKFRRKVVQLMDVPQFEYIYAHSGNKPEDTDGCVILAQNQLNADYIQGNSLALEKALTKKVEKALAQGLEVWWQVVPAPVYL